MAAVQYTTARCLWAGDGASLQQRWPHQCRSSLLPHLSQCRDMGSKEKQVCGVAATRTTICWHSWSSWSRTGGDPSPPFLCAPPQSWHYQHDYTVFLTNSETQKVPWVAVNSSLPRAETACTNVPWRPGWPGMQPGLSDTPSWQLLFSSCMPARTK